MPSPFPGMDPFLESPVFFGTLHDGLIYNLQAQLQRELPAAYYASTTDRLWVEVEDHRRIIQPDVNVLRRDQDEPDVDVRSRPVTTGVAVAEPVVVAIVHDEHREPYVDILSRGSEGEIIVATIEILSPTNKRRESPGRELYLAKQKEVLDDGGIHLVEIDLLRGGEHTTAVSKAVALRKSGGFDYHICTRRADRWTDALVYPIRLRDHLSRFPIPLLPGDGEVIVDLQAAFDRSYDDGPFAKRVDYREPVPEPPLSTEDAAWAADLLATAGK
ncbi:MAG: DUF4058 family protein [Planctomycetota bacterium]|nr:DUF4058 family protein [Planctomycetota bacterium]